MKTATWFALALAAAVTVGGITVIKTQAASAAAPFAQRRAALWSRVIEKLGLTEDQVARIKAELRSEKDSITALLKRLHAAHVELRDTIQQDGASEEAVRAASARVAEVQADLAVERAKLHGRISPILNAEQLSRLKVFQQKVDEFLDRIIETVGERLAGE